MAGPMDSSEQAALWRRWRRAASPSDGAAGAEPDEVTLAAYAEDRLSPEEIEAVEDWLAANPHAGEDIVAARRAASAAALPDASEAMIARASALVGGNVLPFSQRGAQPRWRRTAAWGAMAASIVAASLVGFATGNSTYMTLAGGSTPSLSQELLDPPTGLFNAADEDPSI